VGVASRRNAVVALLVLMIPLAVGASAAASGGPQWTSGVPAFLPAGVGTSAQLFLVAVSCRAAGACTAAGHFVDDRGATQGLLTTETSGRWAVGVEAPLPADTSADPSVTLNSVACGSPGNCVAVGEYEDGSGHTQGLLLTQTSGAWAAGVKVPLPGDAAANPQVRLTSVSCAAASQCAAVGVYSDGSGGREALLLSDASGTWTASAVSLPGDASSGSATDARLNGVACPTEGNCTAIGEYEVGF